jgi:steroid 5-alpha reductase family enzyme
MSFALLVLAGWIPIAAVMTALWLVQRRTGDAGIVDAGWAAGIGALAVFYAVAADGAFERRLLIAAMAATWSLRLTHHIVVDRLLPDGEDGRYAELRTAWGERFQGRIFWFFQAQGLLSVLFSLPALAAMSSRRAELGPLDAAAVAIWLIGVGGESLADRQLAAFRADPSNRGRTCRVGLWRFSRHPNYFFEWLHWWAYAAAAVGGPLWWAAAAAPLVMLLFILFVTGIPPTEARALQSRGEDYRRYQRTTSAFVPWFPKAGED